jgi:hypothetical protein
LIETRRTSSARFGRVSGRSFAGTGRRPGWVLRSLAERRGIRTVLVGSGLAGLLGATACAVASVSAWLVPAYLLLVVVILAPHQGPRASSTPSGMSAETIGIGIAGSGQDSGAGQSEGTGQLEPGPDDGSNPAVPAGESDDAESLSLRADPAANAVARPRRSRTRSRKASRTAAEPAPDSTPVTWIRVGPGKYVRSDAMGQGQPPTEAQATVEAPAVATPDDPVTDRPEPATDTSTAPIEDRPAVDAPAADASAPEEPATAAYPETDAPVAAIIPAPEADATEPHPADDEPEPEPMAPEVVTDASPVAEEYGIAPSAFDPTTPESLPAPCRDSAVLDPMELAPPEPDVEPACAAGPRAHAPGSGQADARPGGQRRRSRTFTRFVPRGIANLFPALEPRTKSSRHGARGPTRPRTHIRCASARESRRKDAARHAFGRTDHVRRNWRARSPPSLS